MSQLLMEYIGIPMETIAWPLVTGNFITWIHQARFKPSQLIVWDMAQDTNLTTWFLDHSCLKLPKSNDNFVDIFLKKATFRIYFKEN